MVDADTIAVLVDRNRPDLRGAARALIAAANDSGGEDNITAVLFELTSEDHPKPNSYANDEADTLHPEDGVALPPEQWYPDADTMVVSAEDWQRAVAAEEQPLPLVRLFAATALIVALTAVIVFLSVWGLTR
jgi:hypothetical protein